VPGKIVLFRSECMFVQIEDVSIRFPCFTDGCEKMMHLHSAVQFSYLISRHFFSQNLSKINFATCLTRCVLLPDGIIFVKKL
jgi:hypothetical protein